MGPERGQGVARRRAAVGSARTAHAVPTHPERRAGVAAGAGSPPCVVPGHVPPSGGGHCSRSARRSSPHALVYPFSDVAGCSPSLYQHRAASCVERGAPGCVRSYRSRSIGDRSSQRPHATPWQRVATCLQMEHHPLTWTAFRPHLTACCVVQRGESLAASNCLHRAWSIGFVRPNVLT